MEELKSEEVSYRDETIGISNFNIELPIKAYKKLTLIIHGEDGRSTGVETKININQKDVNATNNNKPTNWDEIYHDDKRIYGYDLEEIKEHDKLVKLTGKITSKNIFIGGAATITLKGYYE